VLKLEKEIKPKRVKAGYRPPTKSEEFDDMIRKAIEPCRKARRYT
jgi:hypothetical protein